MSWNYWRAGSWRTPTVKQRKNGQWVSISGDAGGSSKEGGDGDVPSRFYTEGPPERSGETIIYDGTNYSSLQAAHDALSPGDTLYIDPSNSPYVERLQITQDHITIESDGAWLKQPDTTSQVTIHIGEHQGGGHGFHSADTSLEGSHSGGGEAEDGGTNAVGDKVISVVDASPFSVGDDIFIEEDRRPWGEPKSGGASGADTTHEYKTVTDVDTVNNTITVHHPLFLPYPNISDTAVGRMDWVTEDIHLTGVNLQGLASDDQSIPLSVTGVRDLWVDMMAIENANRNNISSTWNFNQRYDDITMRSGGHYGININRSSTQTYITNVTGDDIGHYVVRFGPGGGRAANSVDGLVDGVMGRNFGHNGPVANVHWGGFYIKYRNVTGDGERCFRHRSRHVILDGFIEDGAERGTITTRQRPHSCSAKNGKIINKVSGPVFNINTRSEKNSRVDNILFEDITIEAYDNNSIRDIGYFNNTAIVDGITFRNIVYAGQMLERSHVESWSNYDSADISNLTVE